MKPFAVQTAGFDGPLDLLVSIVRREDLSIADLPLAPIAAQYLAYIEAADALDVNLGMEWIEMAARLIHWKSASLLPAVPGLPDPGADLKQELVRALQTVTGPQSWSNAGTTPFREDPPAGEDIPASLWTLRNKARSLRETFQRRRSAATSVVWIDSDPVTVAEMRAFALAALEKRQPGEWFSSADWLDAEAPRSRRIYLFLAVLDLAREGIVTLDDDCTGGSVRVCRLSETPLYEVATG